MTKPILVANWKNHPKSLNEARMLLRDLSRNALRYKKVSFFIAPSLAYFESVASRAGSFYHLATQDMPPFFHGTYTGVVTPDILKSFGVRLVILGHSEQRALGETNEAVSQKIKTAFRSGITPLVCVGETSRDQDGEHFEFLREQLKLSLAGLNRTTDARKLMLAYEPVWSIGKRAEDAIIPADLAQYVIFIKKVLVDMFGRATADLIPVLYGGSVESDNARALVSGTGINGFLVGHASLDARNFKI